MSGELVLLTGATGHLGFRILVLALTAGYRVRAAVRNEENVAKVLSAPSIQALNPGPSLTFTFVPDIIAPGAYDEALKDVKYVIHCASPLMAKTTGDFENGVVIPAVKGTTGILESAAKNPSVKRLVITSSVLAVVPMSEIGSGSGKIFDAQAILPVPSGPYTDDLEAYCAAKISALAATHSFVEEKKPGFDVINILPSYIIGKNELVTKLEDFAKGTNKVLFGQVLGYSGPPMPCNTVWLHDVASLHVKSLDPAIPGNEDFIANSGGIEGNTYSDAIGIIAKKFPEAVAAGTFPNNGSQPTVKLPLDTTKTEKTFGIKFAGLEEQVTEIAEHFLELVAKASEESSK